MNQVKRTESGTFTIDEHRARTHHFDLRLIREGSVAMWAVNSAMPAPGERAHAAIRIDELPLAGRERVADRPGRTAWDRGRMTVRSWQEGEAAVVTLHGACGGGLGGTRTVSLLHVGSDGHDDDHWTIAALGEPSSRA